MNIDVAEYQMICPQILACEDETEWNAIVWEYMDTHAEDYPDPERDFDRAENDLLDNFGCDSEQVDHLRALDII
jgi:hypothetical protein